MVVVEGGGFLQHVKKERELSWREKCPGGVCPGEKCPYLTARQCKVPVTDVFAHRPRPPRG